MCIAVSGIRHKFHDYFVHDNLISMISETILKIKYDIPRGSVLGPILFLLFINDLSNIQYPYRFTLFADDTTIALHKIFQTFSNIFTLVFIHE